MRRSILLGVLFGLLASCSDKEIVGLHLALAADGSGTLTTRTLLEPAQAGPAEAQTKGVVFESRAGLLLSQGKFTNVSELQFGELRCSGDVRNAERPNLRMRIPRAAEAAWVKALAPGLELRRKLAKVLDPTGKKTEIAANVQFELHLPGNVVASGVLPAARGVEASHERDRAYLIVPLDTATEKGEELVWDVSWMVPTSR
ncbi:MAG TPA: hypothetical protein VK348_13870 [Planctomycetota bacterium]|nr:hypothetical protein [Planctomycetota bacterium]